MHTHVARGPGTGQSINEEHNDLGIVLHDPLCVPEVEQPSSSLLVMIPYVQHLISAMGGGEGRARFARLSLGYMSLHGSNDNIIDRY